MPRQPASPLSSLTRRQFGKQAVTAGLTAALAVTPGACQSTPSASHEKKTDDESEARYQQILRRYGSRLSEAQRQHLKKILAYNEKLLAPIRSFQLANGQPAATVLKFYQDADTRALAGQPGRTSQRGAEE
jgi:hypothetical protein